MTRPQRVFLVGCGRSGTTALYNTLAAHGATAWFSRWTDATLRPELAAGAALYRCAFPRAGREARRLLPYPSEGYRLWDHTLALSPEDALRPLDRTDVTVARARAVDELVAAHLRYGRARCFLNKNTRNSRRIDFLSSIYPDAIFVHVIRHPLDVVSSLIEVAWWPDVRLWTRAGASPRSLGATDAAAAALAAEVWVAETTIVRETIEGATGRAHIEIRYEDFVSDPDTHLAALLHRLGLEPDRGVARFSGLLSDRSVGTWRKRLSAAQQDAAMPEVASLAAELGYEL